MLFEYLKSIIVDFKKDLISLIKKVNLLEGLFLTFLLVSQSFYFYRYILRYGSGISPSGYQLTPFIFQVSKFVIAVVFLLVMLGTLLKYFSLKKVLDAFSRKIIWWLIFLFLAYVTISLLKFGIRPDSFGISQTAKMVFVIPFVFFIPFVFSKETLFKLLKIFFVFSLVYHILYETVTIALFWFFGRLPGLAFADKLPRFGGGWDDPNTFGAFLVLIIISLIVYESEKASNKRGVVFSVLLAILFFFLLYTYSITALLGLGLSILILLLLRKISIRNIFVMFFSGLFFSFYNFYFKYIDILINVKKGSVTVHLAETGKQALDQDATLLAATVQAIFGRFDKPTFNENLYIQLYVNYGLIAVFLLSLILLLTIFRAYKGLSIAKDNKSKIVFLISFVYLIAFAFMNFGIPFFQIFPLNLFVWLMIGLVWVIGGKEAARN